ncbi:MAG: HDOD domain-containing protein [Nitrospirales bacterium]|nr:HDOD domain-containing protein [Nitrospirales bacterium]
MQTVEEIVTTCTNLYTLPKVYLEVKKVIDAPEATMVDLSRAISIDPGMTTMVLKLVNSAFYAMPRKVETISRAVGILGMQPLHDLTLAVAVTKTFSGLNQQVMSMDVYWANSFFSGLVARELARKCFLVDSERMFVEGLLREIGHLILYEQLPEQAERALRESAETDTPVHLIEQHLLGFDFTEIGQALVDAWQLPKNLGIAIRFQHQPNGTPDHAFEAALLNMAHALTEGFQSPHGYMQWQALVAPESWTLTGLSEDALKECMLEAGKQLSTMLDLMEEAQVHMAS